MIAWPWDVKGDDDEPPLAEALIAEIDLVTPPVEPVDDIVEQDLALDSLLVEPPAEGLAEPEATDAEAQLVEVVAEEPDAVDELEVVVDTAEDEAVVEAAGVDEAEPAVEAAEDDEAEPAAPEDSIGSSRDEIADFIFELENVTDIPEAAAKESAAAGSAEDGPTCGECVYDETCPNRDQRSPQECGSFQWKIA